jgi:hypothetical protein
MEDLLQLKFCMVRYFKQLMVELFMLQLLVLTARTITVYLYFLGRLIKFVTLCVSLILYLANKY